MEILSYFPVINFRYKTTGYRGVWGVTFLPGEYAERLNVLRAITQTCRTLRQKFLSWLWERVEACVVPNLSAWYIYLGNALESRCHILLKNPPLAAHVRSEKYVSLIPLHLTRYCRQCNVCDHLSLQDGYDPPRLRDLPPVLAESPHFGDMSHPSRHDDETQKGVRRNNDAFHPNCCLTHRLSSHSAVMPKR